MHDGARQSSSNENRLEVIKRITKDFDDQYTVLEGMQMPTVPEDIKPKEKMDKITIDGDLKISINDKGKTKKTK